MSLRTKFTLYISLLIILIISGIISSIFITQKNLLLSQLEENRQKIFKDFTYTCYEALVVKDEIQVLNTIRSIIKTHKPAIVYAGYVSPSNTVLFGSRDIDQEAELKPRIFRTAKASTEDFSTTSEEKVREFAMPIYVQDEYRGTIKAGFSQSFLESQIKEGVAIIQEKIFQVAVFAILGGFILSNVLAFYLNKPIKALAKGADEIGEGNLDVYVDIKRNDELGRLGKTFNQMAKKLKELDELKDGFVSSVSHELRSPLSAIDGYCDYLLEGFSKNMPPEKQEKSLKIIKEATVRLTNFINNILDLAKIKAGRFEIHTMPVKLAEIVQEIMSLFYSLAIQQKKILRVEIPDNLPSIDVDPGKIEQIITNLVGNALKFTQENSEISVSARMAESGRERSVREFVEVWVSDTGTGIPKEALTKVFDKFYQAEENEMKKPKGTGLGLTIVAEIVKLHGGKIWAESVLGKGSTFKFTLPVWKGGEK